MAQLKIGQYLFTRLKQLGIQTVFGVPGGEYFMAIASSSSAYLAISYRL
jgi:TPP-dependent 2-oxoacid decarboxylase